jgi:pimeloyl-ACP methyl ester carboxylesterase
MTVAFRAALVRALILSLAISSNGQAQSFRDAPIRTVALNGIDMAYREVGAGEPVVLLHGFGSCGEEAWAPFADSLAARYRLIIPDLRGHGRSTNPSDAYTHRQSAADVLALLDSLGIARFKAVGISSGGMTLLHAARRAPERIERLVAVGVGTSMSDETRAWVRKTTLSTLPPEVAAGFRACSARGETQAAGLAAQFGRFADASVPDVFAPLDVSGVVAPVLLVQGDRDVFFPVEQTLALYRSLRDAQMWVIPAGDHVPIYNANVPFVSRTLAFLSAR